MKREKINQKIVNSVANSACLSNFEQDTSVNGFVGLVSISNFMCRNKWNIRHGNRQLSSCLLKLCRANLFLNCKVVSIGMCKNDEKMLKNTLIYQKDGFEYEKSYDYVVIAFPLHKNNHPLLTDFNYTDHANLEMKQKQMYYVRGDLNLNWIPKCIKTIKLVSTDPTSKFLSIETYSNCEDKYYKVALQSGERLESIFTTHEIIKMVKFEDAYPDYKKIEETQKNSQTESRRKRDTPLKPQANEITSTYPRVCIDSLERSRVFYLNSIEWLLSSNEMKCISARNIALLISRNENNLLNNVIYASSKRQYYNDICGVLSGLSIFALVFALLVKSPVKKK